jgi:hypothetical protein
MNRFEGGDAPDYDRVMLDLRDYELRPAVTPPGTAELWNRIELGSAPGESLWECDANHDTLYNSYQLDWILRELDARTPDRSVSDDDRMAFERLCRHVSSLHGFVRILGV